MDKAGEEHKEKEAHNVNEIKEIIGGLKKIKGLSNFIILTKKDAEFIRKNEESRNIGVLEAVKRKYLIAFTHDSSFRSPAGEIVIEKKGKIIFPPADFPEINGKNVVSCSPGHKVDAYLRKKMANINEEDATLIAGFD